MRNMPTWNWPATICAMLPNTPTIASNPAGAPRALVAERQGQAAGSDALFTEALAVAQRAEHPETVQRLKCDYAGLLADRGDHADAIRHYRTLAPPARRRPYLQYAL